MTGGGDNKMIDSILFLASPLSDLQGRPQFTPFEPDIYEGWTEYYSIRSAYGVQEWEKLSGETLI